MTTIMTEKREIYIVADLLTDTPSTVFDCIRYMGGLADERPNPFPFDHERLDRFLHNCTVDILGDFYSLIIAGEVDSTIEDYQEFNYWISRYFDIGYINSDVFLSPATNPTYFKKTTTEWKTKPI